MKINALIIVALSLSASASADQPKSSRLDFNSYVRENFQILSHVKKADRSQLAFEEEKERMPANTTPTPQNVDYGVDKNGNGAAGSSKSVWGSMSGEQNQGPAVLPPQAPDTPPVAAPAPAAPANNSSGLPQ